MNTMTAFSSLGNAFTTLAAWIDWLLPFLVSLAVLYFFWGLAQFVLHASEEEARTEAKNIMIWGVVAIFVMVSLWGLVGFVSRTLGLRADSNVVIAAPTTLNTIVPR